MTAPYRRPAGALGDLVDAVRAALTDDLRRAPWRGSDRPTAGHCYVASEALWHLLGGAASGAWPWHLKHEGAPHTFLLLAGGDVLDATEDQFDTPVPHGAARRSNFLPPTPSARTRVVLAKLRDAGVTAAQPEPPAQGVLLLP